MDLAERAPWTAEDGVDGGHAREVDAARVALEGSRLERLRIALRSMARLVQDPDDTRQVFLLGLALNGPAFPALLARICAAEGGLALLSERPSIDSRSVDFDRLRALPAGSLGGAYARYLDAHGLDPDLFQAPPGLPEVPRFVAQRIRQTHDVWHVLTGYAPDVAGELCLQGFTYAQLRVPSSLGIALVGTLLRAPRAAGDVWDGYLRGRAATFLPVVRFEDLWERPLEEVRRELGIRPARRPGRKVGEASPPPMI